MQNTDSHKDETLIKTPSQLATVVLFSFIIPIIFILMVVEFITGGLKLPPQRMTQEATFERMKPIGNLSMAGDVSDFSAKTETKVVSSAEISQKSGEQIYTEVCMACHQIGIAGAPKTGDLAMWKPRIAKGADTLYKNAIAGIGLMPAKGGAINLGDIEIKLAVDYMIERLN